MKTYGEMEVQLQCNENVKRILEAPQISRRRDGSMRQVTYRTECPNVLDAAFKEDCHHDDLAPEICSCPGLHEFFFTSVLLWNLWKTLLVLHRTECSFGPRTGIENESLLVMPLANPLYRLTIMFLIYYGPNSFIDDKTPVLCEIFVLLYDKIKQ